MKTQNSTKQTPALISNAALKALTSDINAFLADLGKKHGIELAAADGFVSKRGLVSINVKGGKGINLKKFKIEPKPKNGETLPEFRMRVHCKQVGLSKSLLGTTVKLGKKQYVVKGLRGKAHNVLLENKQGLVEMNPIEFKEQMH